MIRRRRSKVVILTVVCIGLLFFLGKRSEYIKSGTYQAYSYTTLAMGTGIKKTIYSENAAKSEQVDSAIDACLKELENRISVRITNSEIASCNRSYAVDGVYPLSETVRSYLEQELQICEETDGAFSPCIRPISALWGIEEGETEIPEQSRIQEVLAHTRPENMELTEDGIIFRDNRMAIDLGAVGKGIACDEVNKVLAGYDVRGAVISIGGSIAVYGDKGKREAWHIGIQDPRGNENEMLGVLTAKKGMVISTSGDYEKYFMADGRRYHHIFDPATGYPADSGLISVTIISDSGFLSDALSTACFVLGLEKGMDYAVKKGVQAIFVTSGREVYVTKGLKHAFKLQADGYVLKESR
ncbi:MAG: FAD:protein FMN transferase [Lachnospiraceae bacterium]|nr:FAD:protein FMN transferase [Lachnospiraceae bacterium]